MPVDVLFYAGSSGLITSFTDSLATSDYGPENGLGANNFDWLILNVGMGTPFNTPFAWPTFSFGSALSGGGGTGLKIGQAQTAVNPNYFIPMGVVPVPILNGIRKAQSLYQATKKFIQVTYNANQDNNFGIGWLNFEDRSGTGQGGSFTIAHDCYEVRVAGGSLTRWNSGAVASTLHAGFAIVQNDVIRLGFDSSTAGQTTLTVSKNGVSQYTFTDNTVNRLITNAIPLLLGINGASSSFAEYKNFSCGLGL